MASIEPNPLEVFSTFNYVFTLSALSNEEVNYPDETYKKGGPRQNIILRSGGGKPEDRITIPGADRKFDFYVDNFNFEQLFGDKAGPTPACTLEFTVIEPYSIGLFLDSLQQAAFLAAGNIKTKPNYLECVYLLTIEFVGYNSDGIPTSLPNLTKNFTIKISEAVMNFTGGGCKYQVSGYVHNEEAFTDHYNFLYTDIAISGATVHEILQTGKDSLQNVVNAHFREYAQKLNPPGLVPDQIAIIFPKSAGNESKTKILSSTPTSATVNPAKKATGGVNKTTGNVSGETVTVQDVGDMNEIGRSSMNFDMSYPGECRAPDDNKAQPDGNKPAQRNYINVDLKSREFRFRQSSTIVNVITQVLHMSEFCKKTAANQVPPDEKGMFTWFRIDSEVRLFEPNDANMRKYGRVPRLVIYRVIPYKVHSYKFFGPTSLPVGYSQLSSEIIKEYNYVYTGKNLDIINLDFKISAGFYQHAYADSGHEHKESHRMLEGSATENSLKTPPSLLGNNVLDRTSGSIYSAPITTTQTSGQGGGGGTNYDANRAKLFHEIFISDSADQIELNMTIMGDPYFIGQSGIGNFNNYSTGSFNQTADGSINLQTGEVDIHVNFNVPYDVGENGFADFGDGKSGSFTGLYRLGKVTNKFQQGKFTQDLLLFRRGGQRPYVGSSTSGGETANAGAETSTNSFFKGNLLEAAGLTLEQTFKDGLF